MILKQTTENSISGDSFGEVMESRVNVNKLHKLYGLLSGLYKNLEESIIREYVN